MNKNKNRSAKALCFPLKKSSSSDSYLYHCIKGSTTSKGGNRKTATAEFVNEAFLSSPHHPGELIMFIKLVSYLSIYRQSYSDSLRKDIFCNAIRKDILTKCCFLNYLLKLIQVTYTALSCVAGWSPHPSLLLPTKIAGWTGMVGKNPEIFFFFFNFQKVEPRIIRRIPGYFLFGSKLWTSKVSWK